MSFETECFSMYSDMSKRTKLFSLPKVSPVGVKKKCTAALVVPMRRTVAIDVA